MRGRPRELGATPRCSTEGQLGRCATPGPRRAGRRSPFQKLPPPWLFQEVLSRAGQGADRGVGEGLETQRHRLSHRGRCRKSHLPGTAATGPVSLHGDRGTAQSGVPGLAGSLPVWKDAPRNAVLAPSSPLELVWDTSAHRKSVHKKLALRAASDHNATARPVKWELANGSGLHVRGLPPWALVSLSVDRVGRQWTSDLSPQP